jgi:hypothetical protein
MTRDDLQAFWSQKFAPHNAALVVSGAISMADLQPLVEKAFGDWKPGTPATAVPGEPSTTPAKLVIVDKPGAQQTQLRVTSIGVPRSTPDYEPIVIMNEALGGLFSSRINLNLREAHGYTYGASSQFVFRRSAGPFLVGTGVRTDVTAPSVSEIMKELKRIRESELSPRTDAGQGFAGAVAARGFRDQRKRDGEHVQHFCLRPGAGLLRHARESPVGGDSGPDQGRVAEIHPAGQGHRRGRGRPREDRKRPQKLNLGA